MTGVLLIDKPAGITSHDAVDHIRRASGIRRVGHTGTLDPAATGLLILCLGKATRLSDHLIGLDKTYEGVMRLGVVTESYDLDGAVTDEHPVPPLTLEAIQTVCDRYSGEIGQVPPMVSAVKIGGERLYKRARKGETVEREPRLVRVFEYSALAYDPPDVQIRVRCSRGTYVRSLCHDVGQDLGCGAVLAGLRRTMVGNYDVKGALPLDAFTGPEVVTERLIPMNEALDLPRVVVRNARRGIVASGGALSTPDLTARCPVEDGWVQILGENGKLLALGQVEPGPVGSRVLPKRVFE